MKKLLSVLLIASFSLVLAACGGGDEDNATDTASSGPEQLYNQKCMNCHGKNLEGAFGPELAHIGSKLSKEDIEKIILEGQGQMPKGLLKGEDASSVAEWLANKK